MYAIATVPRPTETLKFNNSYMGSFNFKVTGIFEHGLNTRSTD